MEKLNIKISIEFIQKPLTYTNILLFLQKDPVTVFSTKLQSKTMELTFDQIGEDKQNLLCTQSTFVCHEDEIAAALGFKFFDIKSELPLNHFQLDFALNLKGKMIHNKISMRYLVLVFNTLGIRILIDSKYGFTQDLIGINDKLQPQIMTDENLLINSIPLLINFLFASTRRWS